MPSTVCITFDRSCCPRMAVDVALFFDYFEVNGWTLVDRVEHADLVVVAACGVVRDAETSGFAALSRIDKKRKAGSGLVLVGCLAGISEERILASHPDAALVPPSDSERLDRIINARVKFRDMPDVLDRAPYVRRATRSMRMAGGNPARRRLRSFAQGLTVATLRSEVLRRIVAEGRIAAGRKTCTLRVAWGCPGECTYCAIRYACGPLRSKPFDAVLAEFDRGLADGFTDFELVAADVGCWGQDVGASVLKLLIGLFQRSGSYRLAIDDFNPRWLVQDCTRLIELFAANQDRIESLILPVQSGSERILGLMHRGYGSVELRTGLVDLRKAAPNLRLITHVVVGFPGETDAEFDETRDLLRAVRFNRVDAYAYADRPNTPASCLPGKVVESTIEARCSLLQREFPTFVATYI